MPARYALCFAPPRASALWRFGCQWLGYDAASGETIAPTGMGAINPQMQDKITSEPRRYGFGATLKAPFTLAADTTEYDLNTRLRKFARRCRGFTLPPLQLDKRHGFLALHTRHHCPALAALADACVETFDPFRTRLGADDQTHDQSQELSMRQRALLDRWGYPFVFDQFSFHMPVTGRLGASECMRVQQALEAALAALSLESLRVDAVCLCHQPGPGASFRILARHPFGNASRDPVRRHEALSTA